MPSPNDDRGGQWMTMRDQFNFLLLVCRVWTTAIEVFLHRDLGDRYLGLNAVLVLFLVPIYGLAWEGYDLDPLLYFVPAFLVMCFVARIGQARRRWRGEQCHSMYSGWPRIMGPTAKFSEVTCKRIIEPCLAGAIGLIFYDFLGEVPLGTFLMWGGVCQFITVNLTAMHDEALAKNLYDHVVEQEHVAERFRDMRR